MSASGAKADMEPTGAYQTRFMSTRLGTRLRPRRSLNCAKLSSLKAGHFGPLSILRLGFGTSPITSSPISTPWHVLATLWHGRHLAKPLWTLEIRGTLTNRQAGTVTADKLVTVRPVSARAARSVREREKAGGSRGASSRSPLQATLLSAFPEATSSRTRPGNHLPTFTATRAEVDTAKGLTMDHARRIASNIAKLPHLLGKGD